MSRMSIRKALIVFSAAAISAGGLLIPWSSSSASPPPTTVRLMTVLHQTNVQRFTGDKEIFVSPGVYLAALGGPFEIDAYAAADGSVTLWQVNRTSTGVKKIRQIVAPVAVSLPDGLPNFLDFTLTTARGKTITSVTQPFCPGGFYGYGEARVDMNGPDLPTYPFTCGSSLSQAVVWGLDKGWGLGLNVGLKFPLFLPDGTYHLTVAIDPAYASQLGIPAANSSSTVNVAVTTTDGGCDPEGGCGPVPVPPSRSVAASGSQPNVAPATAANGTPDLRALPAHDLSTEHNPTDKHDYLDFGATIWNGGTGPLDLEGFRSGDSETMQAVQYLYSNGQPDAGHLVGQFEFDTRPGHDHWHMEDVAQYDLLDASGHQVVLSEKQSFCLAPTDPINLVAPGADWSASSSGLFSACQGEDAIWLREVLPAGWGDTYYQSVAGQSFDITNLPNGSYQVRVTTDPDHTLLETNYGNNVGLLAITLGGTKAHRTVTVG